jgi:hypothetical protein
MITKQSFIIKKTAHNHNKLFNCTCRLDKDLALVNDQDLVLEMD